jgi:hypothetical protein
VAASASPRTCTTTRTRSTACSNCCERAIASDRRLRP